jgi:cytochrome c553
MTPLSQSKTNGVLPSARGTREPRRFTWPGALARVGAVALLIALPVAQLAHAQSSQTKALAAHSPPPYWAYAIDPPDDLAATRGRATDATPRHVPDSSKIFTVAQTVDRFHVPDWHPEAHPAMPEIVVRGRSPDVFACGYCHLPDGLGRPENSSLAGLPAGYIVEQLAEFKSGARKTSEPQQQPIGTMNTAEVKASDAEVESAAQYFASLKPRPWIRVVESKSVPKTRISGWMLVPVDAAGTEPIGHRIIEVPENTEQTELRNDTSGFIAYVPPGSLKRGEALVKSGGAGTTIQCSICHGAQLAGLGNVPSLAGRSPSYIVRQLYDIQGGARSGVSVQLMKAVVAQLSLDDMISIAAYTASLKP